MSKVALVEIFKSVQGEGYHSGRTAIFVRTAGCNLACVFAEGAVCDTPYQKAVMKLTVDEILTQAVLLTAEEPGVGQFGVVPRAGSKDDRPMLIITGGEPTMTPQFDALVDVGRAQGFYVAVETNGTKWRSGLAHCDWICVSPKESIPQGSTAPFHNPHPGDAALDPKVVEWMAVFCHLPKGEYRYVIGGADAAAPPYQDAFRHYVSPAVNSDGLGKEWQTGFPGFVSGALARCQEIVWQDPRWRISLQVHKLMGVR